MSQGKLCPVEGCREYMGCEEHREAGHRALILLKDWIRFRNDPIAEKNQIDEDYSEAATDLLNTLLNRPKL